ncbi:MULTISPECIES: hypothetical protein [unclassified Marinobacterium]|uniref:hypothetical protein n=1 Tax=unclassified Marinobacterium TaxID=2644139 RepID=UPI0015693B8A|nr:MULTISPECIES: hypothetical protein [unclassified Marinobacterium]NRP56638.1 hypothetical protein [Marinobacterium sp. xm-d-510]NRP96573.1 hypothetical protein [Marinobacterium sp. xm-a-127]
MKDIIYLIQGKSNEMHYFKKVLKGKQFRLLTWDEKVDGCDFLPNSSWAEGRKFLQELVDIDKFEYVCFIDGDVRILKGDINSLESFLLKKKPAVLSPVVSKNIKIAGLPSLSDWFLSYGMDEQFLYIAVKVYKKVFNYRPFITDFDNVSWHFPCLIFQSFLGNELSISTVTYEGLIVDNTNHGDYPTTLDYEPLLNFMYQNNLKIDFYPLLTGYQFIKANSLQRFYRRLANLKRIIRNKYFKEFYFKDYNEFLDSNVYESIRRFYVG